MQELRDMPKIARASGGVSQVRNKISAILISTNPDLSSGSESHKDFTTISVHDLIPQLRLAEFDPTSSPFPTIHEADDPPFANSPSPNLELVIFVILPSPVVMPSAA